MLTQKHLDELRNSGIDLNTAALNFRSLDSPIIFEYLCNSEKLERLNSGRLAQKWLNRYSHCESGGWWANGLDPLNDWKLMEWGCFKPDSPKADYQKLGKFIKYEHPAKVETRAFFFKVSFAQSWRIARRQEGQAAYEAWFQRFWERAKIFLAEEYPEVDQTGVRELLEASERELDQSLRAAWDSPADNANIAGIEKLGDLDDGKGFWQWVANDKTVPITICEGAKKAACLLANGHAAIALPGVTGSVRVPKDDLGIKCGKPHLIPEIEKLAIPGREFYVCFDQDEKSKTVQAVSYEIFKLGRLLESKKCPVRVIEWDAAKGKGVDDLIVNHGVEAFHAAYGKALPFESWLIRHYNRLTYSPQLPVTRQYLGNIEVPKTAKLICLKSPKGTGKTETISQWASEALANQQRVLLISHRVQLTQALSNRVGIQSIYEVRTAREQGKELGHESEVVAQLQGVGLCIDSLHPFSQARFKAQDWGDALIIIDECEQVFWHTLDSSTCQKDRVAILHELKELFSLALHSNSKGRIILSDADLTDVSVDFVKQTAGQSDITPWVCVNNWKPEGWNIYSYVGEKEEWLIALERNISGGGKPFIMLDSQKLKGRYSSSNLETYLQGRFPTKKILRIDRQTLQLKDHPAFGCISKLDEVLVNYDIVVASPSIETGVSIDVKGHFTSVWGLFCGVLPGNSVRQSLARLREPVDRHIWLAPYGLGMIGRGETSVKSLLQSENKIVRANLHHIYDASLDNGEIDVDFLQSAQSCWAKMAVRINAGMVKYVDSITKDLQNEGHEICSVLDDINEKALKNKKLAVTANRDLNQAKCGQKLETAPLINETEAKQLEQSISLDSEDQQLKLQKYRLHSRYGGAEVTTDLYLRDCAEWYPKIRLHYFLTVGREYLKQRDRSRRDELVNHGRGWAPDLNRNLLSVQVKLLDFLGFPALLESKRHGLWLSSDTDLLEFTEKVLANQEAVRKVLGFSVKDLTPIRIARCFLDKVGVVFICKGKQGSRGEQERVYRLKTADDYHSVGVFTNVFALDDGRDAIFAKWLERDETKAAKVSPQEPLIDFVSTSDTVSTAGNISITTATGYQPVDTVSTSDTKIATPDSPQETKETPQNPPIQTGVGAKGWYPGQRVETWWTVGRYWCEGLIQSVEVNASSCFKAIIKLANGATKYVWDELELVAL